MAYISYVGRAGKNFVPFAILVAVLMLAGTMSAAVVVTPQPVAAAAYSQPQSISTGLGSSPGLQQSSVPARGINNLALDNPIGGKMAPPIPQNGNGKTVLVAINSFFVSHTTTSSVARVVNFPEGHFSSISVTFFDQYVSNPFDTSFIVSVSNVQILAGNTVELENTSVTENVTQYSSILTGQQTVFTTCPQFNPGYSSYLSVWFTFTDGPSAGFPGQVIPAFNSTSFPTPSNAFPNNVPIPFNVSRTATVNFPTGVTGAYMNLYEQQNGNDEFWYTLQPPLREFRIFIGITLVATVQPYPNVQTGGGDLFLWQPILGIGAVLYPPHRISLNPYLSLLEGSKSVTIQVVNDENLWIRVALNFMINTTTGSVTGQVAQNTFSFSNSYQQTPATNQATSSIPSSAAYLNDTQSVSEFQHAFGMSAAGSTGMSSYYTQSVAFSASSTEYDPSFNIVANTPYGTGLVYLQTFSLREYINTTSYSAYTAHGITAITLEKTQAYYRINGTVLEDVILTNPIQIVIGFNLTQVRLITTSVETHTYTQDGSSVTNSYNMSYTRVDGRGIFVGTLTPTNSISSLSYNHAYTMKVQKDISTAGQNTSFYYLKEAAVNNSLTARNGTLILYRVISQSS